LEHLQYTIIAIKIIMIPDGITAIRII